MSFRHSRRRVGDFAIHTLANEVASISIAPELGGRIVSIRDRVSGREWLDGWAPASRRRIWRPTDPSDFETGPGAGIDECLPTVLPCGVMGRPLPDHGELWNRPPAFDPDLADTSVFSCHWKLRSLPLAFERRIFLRKHGIRIDYRLGNMATRPTPFLWAWHPLFSWNPGDQLRFARSETTCLGGGKRIPWPVTEPGTDLSEALFPAGATPAAKVFLGPLGKGRAEIRAVSGARLALAWPAELFPYAGVWITRGFWKGLHHWAIEPTNAPVDRLSDIQDPSPLTMLAPREVREWTLTIGLSPKNKTSESGPSPHA